MKLHSTGGEKPSKLDSLHLTVPDTSSGSEQDGMQAGKKLPMKHSLRKTKSRGKGKGPDTIEHAMVLDEVDYEESEVDNGVYEIGVRNVDNRTDTKGHGAGSKLAEKETGGVRDADEDLKSRQTITADVHNAY